MEELLGNAKMIKFTEEYFKKLYKPPFNSSKGDNGQITIIGGSKLFHGAPLFSLTVASRIVDMVFFTSPEPSIGGVAEQLKSKLFSFIWIPWEETEEYIKKSDAVLIGPGLMRSEETKKITEKFLREFSNKKWVIDAGSLQMMEVEWIPRNSVLTPNKREYKMLFGEIDPKDAAKKYNCVIVVKGPTTYIYSSDNSVETPGGNPGLTKGGSGDVESGLTTALLAKNEPFLAASAASFIVKKSADLLYEKVGPNYSSDDLAKKIPEVLK